MELAAPMAMEPFRPEFLYRWTRRTEDRLGDVAAAAFRAGDELQRAACDLLFRLATLQTSSRIEIGSLAPVLLAQISDAASLLESAEEFKLAEQQIRNTIEVFNLVKNVRKLLSEPAAGELQLPELVERGYALGEYASLWAVEGLGHDYADRIWTAQRGDLNGLLTSGPAREAPTSALTMLHAGMGLCFAERLLKTVTPYSGAAEIDGMVRLFIQLCRQNSRPGYTGCAIESLGLVARTWYPQMVYLVDGYLQRMQDEALANFWHGAGRALYFAPTHLLPELYSPWIAADSEPRHDLGRRNARAGLAWATTLVNLRHPAILNSLLRRRERQLTRDGAFSNGVASSIAVASDVTAGNSIVAGFLKYRPACCTGQLWEQQVSRPAEEAALRYQPLLRSTGRLEQLFRFCNAGGPA